MLYNTENITEILYKDTLKCYCPLGKGTYTNQFKIKIKPSSTIPDYCELHEFIQKHEGQVLIIEQAVNLVFNYLKAQLEPLELEVKSYVNDANHPPVVVTKYYRKED